MQNNGPPRRNLFSLSHAYPAVSGQNDSDAGRPEANMKRYAMALFVFAGSLLIGSAVLAQPATGSFGFNGSVSGFPTGAVRITGGGAYDLARIFVHSGGGSGCLEVVRQGTLS